MSAAILLDSLLAEDVFTISIINRHYEPIRLSLTRDPSSTPESREEWSEILTQSGLSQHRNPADVIVEADDAAFRREVEDAVQRQNLRWFPCQKEDGSWVDKADVERGWEFCRLADGEKHSELYVLIELRQSLSGADTTCLRIKRMQMWSTCGVSRPDALDGDGRGQMVMHGDLNASSNESAARPLNNNVPCEPYSQPRSRWSPSATLS